MASKGVYGTREGNVWVRTVSLKRHFFRKYQGFGFHLHFRTVFQDQTIEGCRIKESDTGQVWFIARDKWLDNALYVRDPKPQYVVPMSAFQLVSAGLGKTTRERHARMVKNRKQA